MLNVLRLLIFPGACLAISWFKIGSPGQIGGLQDWNKHKDSAIGSDILSVLTEQDAAALRINLDAVRAYSHKPDCFKSVAGQIKGHCSESDMEQDSRVSSAISMTLCEVATATHYSIPLECQLFSADAKSDFIKSSPRAQGDCVDALSRSAQLWSSFSGYMREIPQLCHAFRRWNDIDLARNLYHNATVEKIVLIRFILAREKIAAQNAESILQRFTEMEDVTKEMKASIKRQQTRGSELIVHMQNAFGDILDRLWEFSQQAASAREASDVAAAARVEATLIGALHVHSRALSQSLDSLLPPITSRLNGALLHHEAQVGRLDSLLNRTTSKWLDLEMGFSQMEGAFLRVIANVEQVSIRLDNAAQQIQSIRAGQEETKAAASALTYSLVDLTNATSFELGKLNRTLHDVGQQLHVQLRRDAHPWRHIVMKTLELVYRADPGSVAYVEQLFSFKLFLTLLGFGWTAMRAACSVAAALAMFVFLGTRRAFVSHKPIRDLWACLGLMGTSNLKLAAPPDFKWQQAQMSAPNYPAAAMIPAARILYLPGFEGGASDRQIAPGRRKRVSRIPDRLCIPPN